MIALAVHCLTVVHVAGRIWLLIVDSSLVSQGLGLLLPALARLPKGTRSCSMRADIRNWPDASPVTLQDPAYVGVAVMAMQGRPGYTRIRTPYVSDADAARVAEATSHLTADPDLRLDALLRSTGPTTTPLPSLTK